MDKIKIVLVDDMAEIREHFRFIFENEPDIEIVGEASNGTQAYNIVTELEPDIVLMDISMEHETAGIEATRKIKEQLADVKIIMLTIQEDDEFMFKAYIEGALDYLLKTASIVDIINSIHNVYNNKCNLRPEITDKILTELNRLKKNEASLIYTLNIMTRLTTAEFEILKAVYKGNTYKEIAEQRFVEQSTLRSQITKILKKFEMDRMSEVINTLSQLKIFDIYN